MPLQFQYRAGNPKPARVALFPGAWNPPTVAHLAIAQAALALCDEVIWVLPRAFPHKVYDGPGIDARLAMLRELAISGSGFSTAVSDGGLYLEIAREAQAALGPETAIQLLCGRDAAERIATWDYGRPGVFDETIACFPLLVAARAGNYRPDPRHANRIAALDMDAAFDEVSSTEVRRRIRGGEPWRHLVPEPIRDAAASLYGE